MKCFRQPREHTLTGTFFCVSYFSLPVRMEIRTLKDSKPEEGEEHKETFIAFARVYSGMVKKGQRLFVLGPKYDPAQGLSMVNTLLSISLFNITRLEQLPQNKGIKPQLHVHTIIYYSFTSDSNLTKSSLLTIVNSCEECKTIKQV